MTVNTKRRKKARRGFEQIYERDELVNKMFHILRTGKEGIDALIMEMGTMVAEAIMDIEREERSGPEYHPSNPGLYKWAYQQGSIFLGDQKISVKHPRLRGEEGEIPLQSYEALKKPGSFSEELLRKVLRGISLLKYGETVIEASKAFGVSPSSLSRHAIEATTAQLREFKERDLSGFTTFAVFIDTVHRGG